MNLKNRLTKLERMTGPEMMPLLIVQFVDNFWTPEQLQQMNEAEVQGRKIIKVNFVEAKKDVSA